MCIRGTATTAAFITRRPTDRRYAKSFTGPQAITACSMRRIPLAAKLYALPLSGFGRLAQDVGHLPPPPIGTCVLGALLDSLAVQQNGDVCVGTLLQGGIIVFSIQGETPIHVPSPDPLVTNICFGGADMRTAFITCSGSGKLIKTRWPSPGLKLNYQVL